MTSGFFETAATRGAHTGSFRTALRRALSRVRPAALCVTVIAVGFAAAQPLSAQRAPNLADFDQYVAHAAKDWHVPGMAVAIVKDDSLVFAKGYGVLEQGKPAMVDEHTRFAIGSTTKAMTVAALAMLVDEGKLHWDDRVIDHFPDFRLYDPWVTREVTIRDLLTHRTGLPNLDLLWVIPQNQLSLSEMIHRFRYVKPESSFRSKWEYENVMYAVLGGIVAQVSGMSWEQFIRTRIFAPIGMTESIALVSELPGQPNVAIPYAENGGTVRVVPVLNTDAVASAGSVWSSVSDMSKWMRFMLDSGRVGNKRLIQPATFREIITPQIQAPMAEYPALELAKPHFFSYGFGWFVQDYHGEIVWMHTGSVNGMCAIIGLVPSKNLGVYVLENLDHAELRHALMYKVFDMYGTGSSAAGASRRDWSTDLKAMFDKQEAAARIRSANRVKVSDSAAASYPALPLERYVGTYTDSTYGSVQVTLASGSLHARFENLDIGELEHVAYGRFRSIASQPVARAAELTFVPDGNGHVGAVRAFGQTFPRSSGSTSTPQTEQ
ncbi:MAG: serine hydrolase [Gemmatimonadaceae bacterium]